MSVCGMFASTTLLLTNYVFIGLGPKNGESVRDLVKMDYRSLQTCAVISKFQACYYFHYVICNLQG